jgi:hypothetical protein
VPVERGRLAARQAEAVDQGGHDRFPAMTMPTVAVTPIRGGPPVTAGTMNALSGSARPAPARLPGGSTFPAGTAQL